MYMYSLYLFACVAITDIQNDNDKGLNKHTLFSASSCFMNGEEEIDSFKS